MFSTPAPSNAFIRLPIDQKEKASQADISALLAQDIYLDLARLLEDSLNNQPNDPDADVDLYRSHSAILIDGVRGAGKSSVLVNLKMYLESQHKEIAEKVHILKPVDPTLLEDTDDLFLNVIVAAIIRDKAVAKALSNADHKAEAFHHELQVLGNTLENLQSQRNKYGLDKLRAFMGNHDLMQQVHVLFKKALELVGKKLLILPIDDVDTSMNRAFENLEVVRRYLTSPYAQPIITGDLKLYREVTWRDFYGKLTKESDIRQDQAVNRSEELAREYQRKVMPLQLRLEMPTASSYLERDDIILCNGKQNYYSLLTFWRWINALLNERVNNPEGSRLYIEIETVRELTQFIFAFKQQIPKLDSAIKQLQIGSIDEYTLHRLLFMPLSAVRKMEQFSEHYQKAHSLAEKNQRETARNRAYAEFLNSEKNDSGLDTPVWRGFILECKTTLLNYLRHEYSQTVEYFTLKADLHFASLANIPTLKISLLFETPLFRPTQLSNETITTFPEGQQRLTGEELYGRAPSEWITDLPFIGRFPFPLPELGFATRTKNLKNLPESAQLLIDLMLHRSFFSENKKANIIFCGRLFEVVIASFVRDLEPRDISSIIARPPFYSLHAIAGDDIDTIDFDNAEPVVEAEYESTIVSLTSAINEWRNREKIADTQLSSWLTFNVLNRFFRQVQQFNKPNSVSAKENIPHLINVARRAYRSLWNAFASVEKGEVFGMPNIIANVSIGDGESFEKSDLYRQNISPFLHRTGNSAFGADTRSYTSALASHPLRKLIEDTYLALIENSTYKNEISEKPFYESEGRVLTGIIKKYFHMKGRIEEEIDDLKATPMDIIKIMGIASKEGIEKEKVLGYKHIQLIMKNNSIEAG